MYLLASGFTVVACADHASPKLICADVSRLGTHALRSPDTLLLGLSASPHDEALPANADAVISAPILRSDIEAILTRIVRGERIQLSQSAAHDVRAKTATFLPFEALVADDDIVNREVAQEVLRGLGGIVTLVEDGAQAFAAATSRRLDIVFMDGSMPKMDGLTATRHIRKHEADTHTPPTPIVGLTAHVVGVDPQQWRDAGMNAVVHKPFTIAELARTIERLLPHLVCKVSSPSDPDASAQEKTDDSTMSGTTELLDDSIFNQLVDMQAAGQRNLVQRIVGLYAQNAPLALAQIEDAIASSDAENCARAAHSLKSMSFSIGASSVARHAHEIEARSRTEGKFTDAASIETLKHALSETMREIDARMTAESHIETRHHPVMGAVASR